MPKKLGEILIDQGLITTEKLEEGLRIQLLSGTRIGTVLVQLEAVPLDEVGRCLSSTVFPMPLKTC